MRNSPSLGSRCFQFKKGGGGCKRLSVRQRRVAAVGGGATPAEVIAQTSHSSSPLLGAGGGRFHLAESSSFLSPAAVRHSNTSVVVFQIGFCIFYKVLSMSWTGQTQNF